MPDTASVVSLQSAKDFLNITSQQFDGELGGFVAAASAAWIRRVGPVQSSVYDETYDGGRPAIILRHPPVLSITSVVESFGANAVFTLVPQVLDAGPSGSYGYSVDNEAGVLYRRASGVATDFAHGARNVRVVYTAGYATIPADISHAVLLLISHMWETQRGITRRPGTGDIGGTPGAGYMWPNRVQEIAAAYYVPGIA